MFYLSSINSCIHEILYSSLYSFSFSFFSIILPLTFKSNSTINILDGYDYNGTRNRNADVEVDVDVNVDVDVEVEVKIDVEVEADWCETLESTSLRNFLISIEHY